MLDTDVVVAALRSDTGASRQLLLAALDEEYSLLLSVALALEYEAVVTRVQHLSAMNLKGNDIEAVLSDLISVSEPVKISYRWRPQLLDPDDEMVLEAAANGRADALVTFNRRDFALSRGRFEHKLLLPSEALRWVRSIRK